MAVQTGVRFFRVFEAGQITKRWAYIAIGAVVLLNLVALLAYQHYLAVDFPFQDEIGYVNRLHHLPETGLFHYLFDPYWHYFIPTQLYIWYQFYTFAHLNIMVVRYTAAVISALASLLLCAMLYRRATSMNGLTLLVVLCGPFMICSYNHWASYDQSIEAVVEPLLFGLVLALTWTADKIGRTFQDRSSIEKRLGWIAAFVAMWLFAVGIGPQPLVLLFAIVVARLLLGGRIDLPLMLLGIVAVAVPASYVILGEGLNQGMSITQSAFGLRDLFNALDSAVGLMGNSLLTPESASRELITRLFGASVLIAQVTATVYALRLPREKRSRFLIPLALTLYSALVLLEIVVARLHEPGVAFTPRYSMFALSAPISLLFWFVALPDSGAWKRVLGIGMLAFFGFGVAMADALTIHQLPYTRVALARDRATFMSLQGEPTPEQRAVMFVNLPLVDFVYPDLQFLQQEHLAMYQGTETVGTGKSPALVKPPALTVVGFGPDTVIAKTAFHVQPNGLSSIWVRTNVSMTGDVFIVINATKLKGFHHDDIVTAFVPASLYSKPGAFPMYVIEAAAEKTTRSNTVTFVVR